VAAIAAVRGSLVTLSLGYESAGDGSDTAAGWFVSTNLIVTSWSFLARQARGIRVMVTLPTFVVSVDGVLVEALPTLGLAFVHVNPALFKCTGFNPDLLVIAPNALAGQTVFVYPAPSHTGFAIGAVAQASFGTTGYATNLVVSNVGTALYGSAVIRASDYAVVGMVLSGVGQTGAVLALHGEVLLWAVARYGAALTLVPNVQPGFAAPPALKWGLALGQAVGGGVLARDHGVVYLPMVTAAVNPARTSYFVPGTQDISPLLTLGAPATGAWAWRPDLIDAMLQTSVGSTTLEALATDQPNGVQVVSNLAGSVPVAAGIGYATYTALAPEFGSLWRATTTSVITLPAVPLAGSGAVFTLSNAAAVPPFVISNEEGVTNTLPFLLIYADLGMVVFTNSLAAPDVPLWTALQEEIASPGTLDTVPYIAPFACLDFPTVYSASGLSVTYDTWVSDGEDWVAVTWSTSDAVTVPDFTNQVKFQVQYNATTGQVLCLYLTMPGVWPTQDWLTATTMTSKFGGGRPVSCQLVRVVPQPQPLAIVNFGLASGWSNAFFVNLTPSLTNATPPVAAGAVAPTRLPDGSTDLAVAGTLAVIAASGTAVVCGAYVYTWVWPEFDTPVRVGAVNAQPVGASDVNDVSLGRVLTRVAPSATAEFPTGVSVSLVDVAYAGAPTPMEHPETLWTAVRAGLGVPPVLVAGTSAGALQFQFAAARSLSTLEPYSAAAFMLPGSATLNQEADIVSATFVFTVPSAYTPVIGDLFIIQLAATDSSALTPRFANDTDPTCAVLDFDGVDYHITYYTFFGNSVVTPSVLYVPGVTPITIGYTPNNLVSQRVNTVVVGVPPSFGMPAVGGGAQRLGDGVLTVLDVSYQPLAAYTVASEVAYAATLDTYNL
jgi:hypothetical protein